MKNRLVILSILIGTTLGTGIAGSRTWHVELDGSGDVPDLQAAMDSAAVGDTVLVGPGQYEIGPILVASGIVLTSREGPLRTKLVGFPGSLGGLACTNLPQPTTISGLWFDRFSDGGSEGLGAINILDCFRITIRGCMFSNNDRAGVTIASQQLVVIENSTFADNTVALNIIFGDGTLHHNIFWDPVPAMGVFLVYCNDMLNILDVPAPLRSGNFSLDPQFCSTGDYRVSIGSPCAAGNSPLGGNCNLIGALPPDCSTTPTRPTTWGAIKSLYRKH